MGSKNGGRKHNNVTAISVTITSPPSATRPKRETINITKSEIDILVFLCSKEEILFKNKHADYHKKDARNRSKISKLHAIFASCR